MSENEKLNEINKYMVEVNFRGDMDKYEQWKAQKNMFFLDGRNYLSVNEMIAKGRIDEVYDWLFNVIL